eukprot:2304263-Rhodomonas_salina.1
MQKDTDRDTETLRHRHRHTLIGAASSQYLSTPCARSTLARAVLCPCYAPTECITPITWQESYFARDGGSRDAFPAAHWSAEEVDAHCTRKYNVTP